jgi:hypothetical protein
MASVIDKGIGIQQRRNNDNYGQNGIIRRNARLSATFHHRRRQLMYFSLFSERAIQSVYRPPSPLRLHLSTSIFHRSTNQPQMALDMEQVLHTRHD